MPEYRNWLNDTPTKHNICCDLVFSKNITYNGGKKCKIWKILSYYSDTVICTNKKESERTERHAEINKCVVVIYCTEHACFLSHILPSSSYWSQLNRVLFHFKPPPPFLPMYFYKSATRMVSFDVPYARWWQRWNTTKSMELVAIVLYEQIWHSPIT